MKIEIYRKRFYGSGFVVDDDPETVFHNVAQVELARGAIYGNIDGEQLTIKTDCLNYKYVLLDEV